MAYCRFSCDDFRCDLYAYRGDRDYVLHVAGFRFVGDVPTIDWDAGPAAIVTASKAQCAFLRAAARVPIDLPHAGETFHESDLAALRARLLALRALGYRFPDAALERIDVEIAAEAAATEGASDA
jgi:hypothetical protein